MLETWLRECSPKEGPLSATKEEADKARKVRAQVGAEEEWEEKWGNHPYPKAWWANRKFLFVAKQCLTLVTLLTRPR